MKILHILSSDDELGSAKSFLELVEREIKYSDIEPVVITPADNKIARYCEKRDISHYVCQYEQWQVPKHDKLLLFVFKYCYHFFCYKIRNKGAIQKLIDIIKKEKINVIHTNTLVLDVGAELSKITGIPHVWHIREFGKQDFNFFPYRRNSITYMNKHADHFICVSEALKKSWVSRGLSENKTVTISHGVDANRYSIHKKERDDDKIKMVMCGSFSRGKGQLLLVEAVNKLSADKKKVISVDFYGATSGNYYESIAGKVKEYHLEDTIIFKGYSATLNKDLADYDIGVMCSAAEAMGRVTIEYMLSGLCVIASNSGSNIEIVGDNDCGVLFEAGNADDLKDKIMMLMADKALIKESGEKAALVARTNYDVNVNAGRIVDVFRNVTL